MKKARMNISHSRFTLFKLKIFGEIVTTIFEWYQYCLKLRFYQKFSPIIALDCFMTSHWSQSIAENTF